MNADTTSLQPPPLALGGAGFSHQLHAAPESLPITEILLRAFDLGLRTIDTSPYYEPSEQLIGAALSSPAISARYAREDITIMTKVGRITEKEFDYSPDWVRKSVARSLERFQTPYLDVVFCHDVEFVSTQEALVAVGVLFAFQSAGVIRQVGISGYDIDVLANVATLATTVHKRPLDVVQTWAQLTLQNTQFEKRGIGLFRAAGVKQVFCSSPLAIGLLRNNPVPAGRAGTYNWHPAPQGLREAAQQAARWTEKQGMSLAAIAMRYALAKARLLSTPELTVVTITGISNLCELEENVATAKDILKVGAGREAAAATATLADFTEVDEAAIGRDMPLYEQIREYLGPWLDYDFGKKAVVKDEEKQLGADEVESIGEKDIKVTAHQVAQEPSNTAL